MGLACYADPYALIFLPPVYCFAVITGYFASTGLKDKAYRIVSTLVGAGVGLLPYYVLRHTAQATPEKTSLSLDVLPRTASLLCNECLPSLLGTTVYGPKVACDWVKWSFSTPVTVIQNLGAVLFLGLIVSGGVLVFAKRITPQLRRLGFLGFLMLPVTLGGFLLSVMAFDAYSSRYLVSIVLLSPFAIAPAAKLLSKRALVLLLLPYAIAASISCWIGQSPPGILPHPILKADDSLIRLLDAKGIRFAEADYWVSYRLTFLTKEKFIIIPDNLGEDRYRPYRELFDKTERVAYIHDNLRSRRSEADSLAWLRSKGSHFSEGIERLEADSYTIFILHRSSERN
jgi:hypothetical protein